MERGTTRRTRVFCADIARPVATLGDDEGHHVIRVLRLRTGDSVSVFNGVGLERSGTIAESSNGVVQIALGATVKAADEPAVALTLAIGLLKGDAMSGVVRDATMLGIAAIVPFVSAHTALPTSATRARHTDRWTRVAIASARQCGRAVVPPIRDVTTFDAVLATPCDARLMFVEPLADAGGTGAALQMPRTGLVLVGPEGGWSDDEVKRARAAGASIVSLGPRTLRAEIAPAIALTSLWALWGWP